MSKVDFLPYARFLAPSVKRMFCVRDCIRVCVYLLMRVQPHTRVYLCICVRVPVRKVFRCVVASL